MKIWVIGRNYPDPSNNMAGSFELEQAKMLGDNGEDVCYLCCSLHPYKKIRAWGYQSWEEDGITVCANSKKFPPRVFPLYFLKRRNHVWREFLGRVYKEDGKPDIIHIHYPAMLMISDALRPFHKLGVRIVVTEHWTKVLSNSLDFMEVKTYRKYFEYINACICVGSPLANAVKKIVGSKDININVIPNVVNQDFQPIYEPHDDYVFIAVGRLVKIKQFDKIIHAFSELFRGRELALRPDHSL